MVAEEVDGDEKVGLDMFIGQGRMQEAEQVWKDMVHSLPARPGLSYEH